MKFPVVVRVGHHGLLSEIGALLDHKLQPLEDKMATLQQLQDSVSALVGQAEALQAEQVKVAQAVSDEIGRVETVVAALKDLITQLKGQPGTIDPAALDDVVNKLATTTNNLSAVQQSMQTVEATAAAENPTTDVPAPAPTTTTAPAPTDTGNAGNATTAASGS